MFTILKYISRRTSYL